MSDPGDSTPSASPADPPPEAEPPERLLVAIVAEGGAWRDVAALETAIAASAAALCRHPRCRRARGAEASVVLGSDQMVRELNRTYRGKDAPTNVLSFPFQRPPGAAGDGERYLGDVLLAAETVALEAAERRVALAHHVQHLVVHGLLHLLGFEHETDAAAEDMERLEAEILGALGIADPHVLAIAD